MAERPPRDSKPDALPKSDAPPKKDASTKSDAPPAPAKPALPERINTIDIMPGTLIGAHLPPLLEAEAAKRAAAPIAAAPDPFAKAGPERGPEPPPALDADEAAANPNWRSPLQSGPAWLAHLRAIPPRLALIAIGGVMLGALLMSGVRGCVSGHRVDNLEDRVARLEQKLGVSADAGASSGNGTAASPAADASGKPSSSSSGAPDPKKVNCALAKVAAYQAWQDALAKAKANAAPAEAACADMWTQSKKQACYYAASQNVRGAQAARDSVMKGGTPAREAVKNVKDDPKNDAVAPARAASETAFGACSDENEF